MGGQLVRTVEVPLQDGGDDTIRVQIREVAESLVRVGRGGRAVTRAERTFDQTLGTAFGVREGVPGPRRGGTAHAPDGP